VNVERMLVGPFLNAGADAYRVAVAQGVTREMLVDALAGAVWDAAAALDRERPGRWDGNDALCAANPPEGEVAALLDLVNQSVVAYPLDTVRAVAPRVVEAHGRRRLLEGLAEVRGLVERGEEAGEAWGRLLEVRATAGRAARLSFMDAGEILDAALPPKVYHVFPWLASGELSAIVGAGGTGKSRFVLYALASVIAGARKVGSMEIPGGSSGGRWLVVGGNENDVHRYRMDLEELARAFPEAVPELRRRLVFHVYRPGDKLLDAEALLDVEEKVRELGDVEGVVIDPLSDMMPSTPDASLNDDSTMKGLCVRIRDGIKRVAPKACVLLVHHARGGREAMGRAVDAFEAGEAGRNSKMLAATCRCVLNLVPFDEAGGVVGFVGKCNDARKPDPFALRKVDGAGYAPVEDFDVEWWLSEVVGRRRGGGKPGPEAQYSEDGRELERYFPDDAPMKGAEVVERAGADGICRSRVYTLLGFAQDAGWLECVRRGVYRRAE